MIVLLDSYNFSIISTALFITTLIALMVFAFLWQRKTAVGAFYLALFELAIAIWALAAAFEAAAITLPLKMTWGKISYLGIVSSPIFYFLFAMDYTHQARGGTFRQIILLAIIPAITLLLAITNDWHSWFWPEIYINPATNMAVYEHGSWFWVFVVFTYGLLTSGTFSLYRGLKHFPHFYRTQFIALLLAAVLPFTGNVMYLIGFSPIPGFDWTPITFTATGIILTWAILKLQFFDLMPVARTQLIESMFDNVLVLDKNNRIVDMNPSAQSLLSHHDNLSLGHPIEQLIPEWTNWHITKQDATISSQIELCQPHPKTLDMRISPLYDRQNRFLGRLIVLHDMTHYKEMEDFLRQLNANLEMEVVERTSEILAEKEKAETILQSVGDAILLTDLNFRIQYVNDAYTKLTGYTAEELFGTYAGTIGAASTTPDLRALIREKVAEGKPWHGETESKRKDGRFYTATLIVSPVHNGEGKPIGYVSSHQDISQQKALERARSQFLTNVSHELRTPVSNIKLYTQLMQSNRHPHKTDSYLEILAQQASRLEDLITNILDLAQIDSGMGAANWHRLNVGSIIQTLHAQSADKAHAKKIELTTTMPPKKLTTINGDQTRIMQALTELIDNAITFTPDGGKIEIRSQEIEESDKSWMTISIADSGPGIPIEEQDQIFDRFFRGSLAADGHIPGTGLGLNIVKEIMNAHGGHVTVSSTINSGTCFTIWLPIH